MVIYGIVLYRIVVMRAPIADVEDPQPTPLTCGVAGHVRRAKERGQMRSVGVGRTLEDAIGVVGSVKLFVVLVSDY